ncbi:MAG: hypothetical protein AAGI07_12850, partial [Bacteroidota bacterium]
MEKSLNIPFQTHYHTMGNLTEKTKFVWIACHGYGQLAKHFMRRFDVLNPNENYVIIPQGLSRFYLTDDYSHVGASWMTKEHRNTDILNQQHYLSAVFDSELQNFKLQDLNINLFGFSQGVATVWRWATAKKIAFHKLIMWAGEFPREFKAEDLAFVPDTAKIYAVIGKQDQYYQSDRFEALATKMEKLCKRPKTILFEGKHE